MKKTLVLLLVLLSVSGYAQDNVLDSLSTLISATSSNVEKAKLLLKRSKAHPALKIAEPKQDAFEALKILKDENDDKLKIEVFNQLSAIFFREDNFLEAINYDNQALDLAVYTNDAVGKVRSYKNLGRNLKALGSIQDAIQKTELSKQIANEEQLLQELPSINNALGILYRIDGQFNKSIAVLDDALKYPGNKKYFQALVSMNKGNTLSEVMRLEEAVTCFLDALKISEALNDERGKLLVYNNLGVLFKRAKQYDKAIYYTHKSLLICKKNNIKSNKATSYDNLANLYDLTNRKDSIVWYRNQAIAIFESIKDEKNTARCYHNLGHYYLLNGNLSGAKKNLKIALLMRTKIDSTSIDVASTLTSLGIVADKEKRYNEAAVYLLKAQKLVGTISIEKKKFILDALAEHYKLQGDLENALKMKEAAAAVQDSLLNSNVIVTVLKQEHKFELDKKDAEIKTSESFKEKYNSNRLIFALLLFFVFIIAVYSFVRWKKLDFQKKQLIADKFKIEVQHQAVNEKLEEVKKTVTKDFILLKNNTKVYLNELLYIRSDDHYVELVTTKKTEIIRTSLKIIAAQLPPNFVRCHKSYIVNANFIKSESTKEYTLMNHTTIPKSKSYRL
jgi:tetratricopeptide (TPR) repeat protein